MYNLLKRYFRISWQVDGSELTVTILESAHAANHCRIIGGIAELRDIDGPAKALGMIAEGIAETVVGTHATSHSHMLDARLLHSHAELLHQDIHDGELNACSQVELVLLYEVRIRSHPLAQTVEETGLEAGKL